VKSSRKHARQKEQELSWYHAARRLCSSLPSGEPQQLDPPAPDLVFAALDLGIEITEYLESEEGGSPLRRLEEERDAIIADAQRAFAASHTEQISVTAWWKPGCDGSIGNHAGYLSTSIAAVVSQLVRDGNTSWRPDWRVREDIILGQYLIGVDALPSKRAVLWQSSGSAMIPDPAEKLQKIIHGKASKLHGYRQSCTTVWLLIVAEPSLSTYFSPDEGFDAVVYRTPFDRVLVFDRFQHRVLPLKIAG
jgi:hypothetical protein